MNVTNPTTKQPGKANNNDRDLVLLFLPPARIGPGPSVWLIGMIAVTPARAQAYHFRQERARTEFFFS
jgi:hypothetical protein